MCNYICSLPYTVSKYNPDSDRRLREMGLVQDAIPQTAGTQSFLTRMLRTGSTNSVSRDDVTFSSLHSENGQLQQQLTQSRSDNQQLRRVVEEKSQENTQLQHQLTQLTRANYQRQLSDTENQQLIATLRGQVDILQRRMASQSVANHSSN